MNTKIDGREVIIHEPEPRTFKFLSKPYNFNSLMPEEVQKFEAGDDWFLFMLKGMPEVKMKVSEIVQDEKIVLKSASDKIPFELICHFTKEGENTRAQLKFAGQFNMMLKMMVEKPLRSFLDKLTDNLEKL